MLPLLTWRPTRGEGTAGQATASRTPDSVSIGSPRRSCAASPWWPTVCRNVEACGRARRAVGLGIPYRLLSRSKGVGPHEPLRDSYKTRRKSPIIEVSGGRSYAFWTSQGRARRPFRTTRLGRCDPSIVFSNIRVTEQLPPHCSRGDEIYPARCTAEWFLHRGGRQTGLEYI